MLLSANYANVDCRGVFEPRRSCATILDDMQTTQLPQRFGPQDDPTAQVTLPAVISSSKLFYLNPGTRLAPPLLITGCRGR